VFSFAIRKLDLKTPGREDEDLAAPAEAEASAEATRGQAYLAALGGRDNLVEVSACTTRLRLIIADHGAVDEARLKALGARGIVRPSDKALQVILGPVADIVSVEIREAIAAGPAASTPVANLGAAPVSAAAESPAPTQLPANLVQALGGEGNVRGAARYGNRLRVELADASVIGEAALTAAGVRAIGATEGGAVHLLFAAADLDRIAA
jgi:PTS system N-acetylglucosamine-specific IIC component